MKKLSLVLALVLFGLTTIMAQRTITGTVSDETGEALIGASVLAKGTATGTVTDVDGSYSLRVADNTKALVFSYTGFDTKEVEIGASNTLDCTMAEGVQLKTVTVNALGLKVNRDKQGSATSTVGGGDVVKSGETGVLQGLAGKSSSLTVTRSGGDPGAGAYIQIRGQNTITGNTQPLIIIDGMPMSNSSYGDGRVNTGNQTAGVVQQSRLNDINPDDIESVEVLKGAAAAALWGTRAANGVIVITTKKGGTTGAKKMDVNFRSSVSFDQVNTEHPLQDIYGQGRAGNWIANVGESWGDKIADRPGGADLVFDQPGVYFNADGADLYNGYFEAEDGTRYYDVFPANTEVYNADGTLSTTTDQHGGKRSTDLYLGSNRDQVFRDGIFNDNSLSISGGDLTSNFFASVSDLNQKGIINGNSDYRRTTFRFNGGKRFNDYIKFSVSSFYSKSGSNRIQTGSNLSGLYLGYLRTASDFDNSDYRGVYYNAAGVPGVTFDADGAPTYWNQRTYRRHLGNGGAVYNNPGWTINEQINTSSVDRYMFTPELNIDPTTWLRFTARVGIDNFTDNRYTYFPYNSAGDGTVGSTSDEIYAENQLNTDIFATASRTLSDAVSANLTVGYNYNDRKFKYLAGTQSNFTIPGAPYTTIDNSASADNGTDNFIRNQRSNAGYADLNLDIANQLTIGLTGRAERASTFKDLIFYPSASVAWRFTELGGLKGNDVLSFGKLRASYGTVGIQPQPYLTTTDFTNALVQESWGPNLNAGLYGGSFTRSRIQGNPDLIPEQKTELEFGVDFRLLRERIGLSATYYTNTIEGAIFAVDVPASTGFASKWENAATLENNGFELDLDADIVNAGDFRWNLYGNWSRNRNTVVDLQGVQSIFLNGFTGTSSRAVEGEPLGALWGGRWDRAENGDLVLDENGFPTQALEEGIVGDPNPDWRGGLGSIFSYKGVTFSFLFETMQGNEMWGGTRGVLNYFGRHPDTAVETVASTDLPTLGGGTIAAGETFRGTEMDFGGGPVALDQSWYQGLGGGFGPIAEQFIYDASWTRLREISLSYRLKSDAFQEATKLDFLEVGLTGRNLLLWTDFQGQDPDMNLTGASNGRGLDYFSNPGTKSWIITLKINY